MIRQRLNSLTNVVPNLFRFTCPETGFKIEHEHTLEGLYAKIKLHYDANEIPLPADWKEAVQDQLCHQLPEGFCHYDDGNPSSGAVQVISADNIIKGITSLATMALNSVKGTNNFVDQDEANRRAEICIRCYQNVAGGFCAGCGAGQTITALVAKVKGGRKTPYDSSLQNCGICGCRNEAIVHVNRNILLSGEKSETTKARPDWCWLKTEDLNLAKSEQHI
jgi:hypothetical protein